MTAVAVAFLTVSLISLTVYTVAFWSLRHEPLHDDLAAYRGLIRTALSRVGVALLYVTLGISAVLGTTGYSWAPLAVFSAAQVCWQVNAVLDVRLKRRLNRRARAEL